MSKNDGKKKKQNPIVFLITTIMNLISFLGIMAGVAKGLSFLLGRLSRDDIAHLSVLGGDDRQEIAAKDFRGGVGACMFGNAVVDCSKSGMKKQPASMVLLCAFGNLDVKVPKDWKLKSASMMIFGGYQHKKEGRQLDPEAPVDLDVFALVMFGSINIIKS